MLMDYYEKRGYDSKGAPDAEKLRRLGIEVH
jgi:aldehyde:ferredoxin oxidoreductase